MNAFANAFDNWYSTAEVMAALGVSRARVSAMAKAHRWQQRMVGRSALYAAADVERYAMQRMRRDLAMALGWRPRGLPLVAHDKWDTRCRVDGCERFAIEYEGRWRCASGHEGEK